MSDGRLEEIGMGERRVAGFAGVVFAVSTVLQFVVAPAPPSWDASGAEVREWFVDHRDGVLVQGWLMVVAVFAFIVFLVGVCGLLRRSPDGAVLATVAALGGAIVAVSLLVGQAAFNAAVWIDGNAEASADDTVRLVWSIACLAIYGASMPGIVLVAGAVAVGGSNDALPVWSVRVAAGVALLGVAGTLIQFGPNFAWFALAAFLGLVVFGLALAIPMIARRSEGENTTTS
jgi:hypothetical protein